MPRTQLWINIGNLFGIQPNNTTRLSGTELSVVKSIADAYLIIDEEGCITQFGPMHDLDRSKVDSSFTIHDLQGKAVLPGFCDSHSHIVFAATREGEWRMRHQGRTYEEIAASGGGILNSAIRLQSTDEDSLYHDAALRLKEVVSYGTTSLEIKSGYGLSVDSELKMLRVIRRLKENFPVHIKANFLGAHAIPSSYKNDRATYINLVINEMLPRAVEGGLADYCDVFCDEGFFTPSETDQILKAAANYGLKPKIHANELANSGGVQVGIANNAISVDHLERIGDEEIAALGRSQTIATVLPSVSFFLKIPYAPARKLIDRGAILCLASDFNPGSSPGGNMQFIISLACYHMGLSPEEAFNAATINGAAALEMGHKTGSITKGKYADLIITRPMSDLALIPYSYATNLVEQTYVKGLLI